MTLLISNRPSLSIQSNTELHNRSGPAGSALSAGQSAVPGISTTTAAHPRAKNSSHRTVLSGLYPSRPVIKMTVGAGVVPGTRTYSGIESRSLPTACVCGMEMSCSGEGQSEAAFA